MKLEELKTIEQISQFLDGTQSVIFKVDTIKAERYKWIQHELVRFGYLTQSKQNKGILTQYIMKVSRYSRQQLNHLVKQYRETGYIRDQHVVSTGYYFVPLSSTLIIPMSHARIAKALYVHHYPKVLEVKSLELK